MELHVCLARHVNIAYIIDSCVCPLIDNEDEAMKTQL